MGANVNNGDSGSFSLQRNQPGGGLSSHNSKETQSKLPQTISNSPSKNDGTIKNKRIFIENTVDSILQSKSSKATSFMGKPVGVMSGTGTTDVRPKVHSVSPRGTVGSSIVGLPNVHVWQASANITK